MPAAFGALAFVHLGRAFVAVLGHGLAAIVALIVVFEEWGWRPLANLLGQLARLSRSRGSKHRIRLLPPYARAGGLRTAVGVAASAEAAGALPHCAGQDGPGDGSLFVGAKVVGTALIARLYSC